MAAYKRVAYETDLGKVARALVSWPCQITPLFRHDGGTFRVVSRSGTLHVSQAMFDRAMIEAKPERLMTQYPLLVTDYVAHRLRPAVQCPELVHGYVLAKALKDGKPATECIVRIPGRLQR